MFASTRAHAVATPALTRLVVTEATLFLRERTGALVLAVPLAVLLIFGSFPWAQQPSPALGGLRFVDVYVPTQIAFALTLLALNALPQVLVAYREKGILRRLSTTPLPPSRVLAAQLAIHLVVAVIGLILILGVARLAFDVGLPRQVLGFVLAFVLAAIGLLALGLVIAALAPTGRAASGFGGLVLFPLLFFAGLWLPRAAMPDLLRHISDVTPLGAAVQALQDTTRGSWPQPLHLAVLAAYALVFGLAAVKWFRWE